MRKPHPFIQLFDTPTDLEDWLAIFCARRTPNPFVGPPFPALVAGQTPADWLVDQFARLGTEAGVRDRLRTVIVRLIATHGGREQSPQARDQIVGTLLNVAGDLKFTEIAPHLLEWVRKPWFREPHSYTLGSTEFPLRRTVWSLLLSWGSVDRISELTQFLTDLTLSGETGTSQLAFVALGERHPTTALMLMPDLLKQWPLPYWMSAATQFLRTTGARALLSRDHAQTWSDCVGHCLYGEDLDRFIRDPRPFAEADTHRENYFYAVMNGAGIHLDEKMNGEVTLSAEGRSVKFNISSWFGLVENSNVIPDEPVTVDRLQIQ